MEPVSASSSAVLSLIDPGMRELLCSYYILDHELRVLH